MKILMLCIGNSCRNQMAQDFLKSFDKSTIVHSSGKFPAAIVNPGVFEDMADVRLISARIR